MCVEKISEDASVFFVFFFLELARSRDVPCGGTVIPPPVIERTASYFLTPKRIPGKECLHIHSGGPSKVDYSMCSICACAS